MVGIELWVLQNLLNSLAIVDLRFVFLDCFLLRVAGALLLNDLFYAYSLHSMMMSRKHDYFGSEQYNFFVSQNSDWMVHDLSAWMEP
jgi:hypothetical protein